MSLVPAQEACMAGLTTGPREEKSAMTGAMSLSTAASGRVPTARISSPYAVDNDMAPVIADFSPSHRALLSSPHAPHPSPTLVRTQGRVPTARISSPYAADTTWRQSSPTSPLTHCVLLSFSRVPAPLPHLSRTQGRVPTARISSPYAVDNDMAPVIADFSSRGPVVNPAMQASWAGTNDILKPDVVGPGVNLWGPWRTPSLAQASTPNFGMVSGTSMATPHLAGLAALVVQKNPTWSPAQIISAFMTTASTTTNRGGLIPTDTGSVATPWDMGQGQVNTSGLLNPGLTYDASYTDFVNFLAGQSTWRANNIFSSMQLTPVPAYNLNRASISVSRMKKFVTINRRVTSVWTRASTYRAVLVVPDN
ncbi:unnamed protein product, partial [Closterium sp. Naga37s-1]